MPALDWDNVWLTVDGNYAEKSITATRSIAASYGKYSKQNLVEPDGEIDYVIYYNNNAAATENDIVLLDTMPYNGELGNAFTGDYTVNSWKIDSTKCDPTEFTLYYTTVPQYVGKVFKADDAEGDGITKAEITAWYSVNVNADGTLVDESEIIGKKPVAWALIGSLESNKSVYVDMTIKLNPGASNGINNVYHNVFSNVNTSIPTTEHSVIRTIEGLTWLDENADGVQDSDETRFSGVAVSLWKLKDDGDASNETDYEKYCYPDTEEQIVIETGKQISVLASPETEKTDYELGRYKFTDLPAGTFAVKFEDGISDYIASPADKGGSDLSDSDGIAQYSSDRTKLLKTVICGIELPAADTMSVALYESKNHDSGFYERGYELPKSGGSGTAKYTAGGFLMVTAVAILFYINKQKIKYKH